MVEDPATGAAAAALAGALCDAGQLAAGGLTVLQGDDMGARSTIETRVNAAPGSPVEVAGATAELGAELGAEVA